MVKRIFKHRLFFKLLACILNAYVWLVFKSCKVRYSVDSQTLKLLHKKQQVIFTFWHGRIFPFPRFIAKYVPFSAVVSTHTDAEVLAQHLLMQGHKLIRGSSGKNGISAMMGIVRHIKAGNSIGITPDGPKGPRFKIKGNTTEIARRYKLPIIHCTFSARNAKVFNSWDRFVLPIPFRSELIIALSAPMFDEMNDEQLEFLMLKQVQNVDAKIGLKIDY